MTHHSWTRRAALIGLAATSALAPLGALALPPDQPGAMRLGAIKLDLKPLRAKGAGTYADWLAADMPAALRAAFAAHFAAGARGGATLVVRVDSVSLGPPGAAQGMGGFPSINDTKDFIEGEASLVEPGGRVIGVTPLMSALGASTNDPPPLLEQQYHDRVVALGRSFAQWLPSRMGL